MNTVAPHPRRGYFDLTSDGAYGHAAEVAELVTTEFLDRLSDAAHSGVLSEQLSDDLRAAVWFLMHLLPDKR